MMTATGERDYIVDTIDSPQQRRAQVMMITEGTYPYHWGGVSTWCHLLLSDLSNVDFTLVSLVGDPAAKPQFKLPASVVDFRSIPIWGVREASELRTEEPAADFWLRRQRTGDRTVAREFVPLFRSFLDELLGDSSNPHYLARLVHGMHRFFLRYDFDKAMRTQVVWDCFVDVASRSFPRLAAQYGYPGERFALADLTTCYHWLYHWLIPLSMPLPKVDVAHAAMAGVCTLVAVAVKMEHGAAFMLTEHGIYLRERYLAEAVTSVSLFRKLFSLRFARRMTELTYAMADLIAPCCEFNHRWELRNGAQPDQLKTIYYGVDSVVFTPQPKPAGEPPVVVWVGRIDPLKDILTLLRAAAIVHATRPDVEFRLFGSAPPGNEAYYEKCLELRRELGLEQAVVFAGFRANPAGAFNEGDIAVLSSVSEAFPFVILEAMLCEKPVVATAVGGVPEQLEGCGIAVEPRNHEAMANALLKLINDPELCQELGTAARQKAEQEYSVRQSAEAHDSAYRKLMERTPVLPPVVAPTGKRYGRRPIPFLRGRGMIELPRPAFAPAGAMPLVQSGRAVQVAALAPAVPLLPPMRLGAQPATPRRNGSSAQAEPQEAWRTQNAAAIVALAAEVAQRDVQPIEGLEVTAVLESIGITDDVAVQRYGAPDAFALGDAVFEAIRAGELAPRRSEAPSAPRTSFKEVVLDYLKGPLGLVPPLLLLLLISLISQWGGWAQRQVLLFGLGITTSLILSNGLIQGLSRRMSLYLGTAKPRMAAHFLTVSSLAVVSLVSLLILISGVVLDMMGVLTDAELATFLLAFGGLTLLWMLAGGLSLLQQPVWLSVALGAGLLTGVVVNAVPTPRTEYHLVAAATLGYGVALVILLIALRRAFVKLEAKPTSSKARIGLPSAAYMINEAAPYFAYGLVYMVLIFLPHLFGWLGKLPAGMARTDAVTVIEVGLTLSLPPLILAYGVAENTLRHFWRQAAATQAMTPANEHRRFGMAMLTFAARRRRLYWLLLTLVTLAGHFLFSNMLAAGWFNHWWSAANQEQLLWVFDMGLVAYWLLGIGVFNCMLVVTLGRPQVAFRAVLWGALVMLATGALLSSISFIFSVGAFGLAAFVFLVVSWDETNEVLRSADYSFASVLP